MISREEAVKLLNSLHYKILHTSFCNKVREAEIEALVMAKELLEQPKTDWIPCEERLPSKEEYLKDDGRFIVTDGNRIYQSCFDIYEGVFKTIYYHMPFYECRLDECIIAWQPLPQPYKKEGAE